MKHTYRQPEINVQPAASGGYWVARFNVAGRPRAVAGITERLARETAELLIRDLRERSTARTWAAQVGVIR